MDARPASTQEENHLSNPVLADIRDEWGWVGPALQELKTQIPSLTWRPEDVYAECLYGNALLYVASEGFRYNKRYNGSVYEGPYAAFLDCWARELGGNCVIKYLPFFRNVAQQLECKVFEVWTPVEELEPYLKEEGWSLDTRIFYEAGR